MGRRKNDLSKLFLTKRNLEHIMSWAQCISRDPKITWNVSDAKLYFKIEEMIKINKKLTYGTN